MVASGKERAKLHTINDPDCFARNTQLLKTFIELAATRNIRVILYTPPAHNSYVQNLNPDQLKLTVDAANAVTETYPNVSYYNFLTDSTFTETDFFDSDHLNEKGAEKLSLVLDTRLKPLK
jgi:lysophospholipase L1-like esterase